jgi:hypothetical protein
MRPPSRRNFLTRTRSIAFMTAVGVLSVGFALYLRYRAIEPSSVGLACQAGLNTWLCFVRKIAIALFTNSVFGWIAMAASVLNFIRPSPVLFGLGLIAASFGIVLYNVGLSALAAGLLILSLARPAPETE